MYIIFSIHVIHLLFPLTKESVSMNNLGGGVVVLSTIVQQAPRTIESKGFMRGSTKKKEKKNS